ncbi:3722_t:CDS:10, partial [Acaulospora morrowiae]
KIRLIDYELMTDEKNKRLVLFGTHAGYAGMIDGLHGLGLRLLGLGYNTPFMPDYTDKSFLLARRHVSYNVGDAIAADGLPKDFGPMIFAFTGTGNVSKGAQDIFRNLPHDYVEVKDLPKLINCKDSVNKIYGCNVQLKDYITPKGNGKFDKQHYYSHPEEYVSHFHTKVAPYATMLIHGSYWDTRFPRLITTSQLRALQSNPNLKHRLLTVADISCDINGALEFLSHSTTIDDPFYYVDAVNGREHKRDEERGTQIMAVDILPTEIPLESSKHFSKSLYPYLNDLVNGTIDSNPVLARATITRDGKLVSPHEKLYDLLPKNNINAAETAPNVVRKDKKKILLLGSGFVAKPLIDYLVKQKDFELTIASNIIAEANALARGDERIKVVELDVKNNIKLSELVKGSDAVVSLIPASLHHIVAEACILYKKHMITASYISPEMRELDDRAKNAGITLLNEIGVDPGIDHLSAMKIIDEVKAEGGEITSFTSWCGGLPAPEASDVPLGYKFSWSPKGALLAALNNAQFWMDGELQRITGENLLKHHFPNVPIYPGFAFEGLANRDSLSYLETYGLHPLESKKSLFRGTLRYKGFSDLMYSFYKIGLLDVKPQRFLCHTWPEFLDNLLFEAPRSNLSESSRMSAISQKLDLPLNHHMVETVANSLKWLSLIQTQDTLLPITRKFQEPISPLDLFCVLLQDKLKYNPGERDLLVLHHEFGVKLKNGHEEKKVSTLISYGSPETYTAMARTVGLPAAIATEMILRGNIPEKGVITPTLPHIYNPILGKLDEEGIKIVESTANKEMNNKLIWDGSGIWK